jgi:hypothetical protein
MEGRVFVQAFSSSSFFLFLHEDWLLKSEVQKLNWPFRLHSRLPTCTTHFAPEASVFIISRILLSAAFIDDDVLDFDVV